jgi:hypothetical protein
MSDSPRAEEIVRLLERATDEEKRKFARLLRDRPDLTPGSEVVSAGHFHSLITSLSKAQGQKVKADSLLHRRTPKPRNAERNAEIVRLRDECNKTFGQIGTELRKINPKWVGKNGKRLSYAAVEKAYRDETRRRAARGL